MQYLYNIPVLMKDYSTLILIILYTFILAWSVSLCNKWFASFEFSFIKDDDWRRWIKITTTLLSAVILSAIISLLIVFIVMALAGGGKDKKGKK